MASGSSGGKGDTWSKGSVLPEATWGWAWWRQAPCLLLLGEIWSRALEDRTSACPRAKEHLFDVDVLELSGVTKDWKSQLSLGGPFGRCENKEVWGRLEKTAQQRETGESREWQGGGRKQRMEGRAARWPLWWFQWVGPETTAPHPEPSYPSLICPQTRFYGNCKA